MSDILYLQIALAGGYMGYLTAYSGLRAGHRAQDAVFMTLAFGLVSALAWQPLSAALGGPVLGGPWAIAAAPAAVVLPVLFGALWRRGGRTVWYEILGRCAIHADDGLATAWQSLTQHPQMQVTQIMVRDRDGTEYVCTDAVRRARERSPFGAIDRFSPMFGTDGAIVMVADRITGPDGEPGAGEPVDDEWGANLTYIPADRIARVEMRVRDAG